MTYSQQDMTYSQQDNLLTTGHDLLTTGHDLETKEHDLSIQRPTLQPLLIVHNHSFEENCSRQMLRIRSNH